VLWGKELFMFWAGSYEQVKKMSNIKKEEHQQKEYDDLEEGPLYGYDAIKKRIGQIVKKMSTMAKCYNITEKIQEMVNDVEGDLNKSKLFILLCAEFVNELAETYKISKNRFCLDIVYCIKKVNVENKKDSKVLVKRKLNFNLNSGMFIWIQPFDIHILNQENN
jgi:hypothetical protein